MAEVTDTPVAKRRGRKPDPNKPKKEKKEVTGRKYHLIDAERYRAFLEENNLGEGFQSKEAVLREADSRADAADEAGNPNVQLAIFEEVGIYGAKIEKKVKRAMVSSRTVNREKKAETTSEGASPAPEPTEESTPEPEHAHTGRSRRR